VGDPFFFSFSQWIVKKGSNNKYAKWSLDVRRPPAAVGIFKNAPRLMNSRFFNPIKNHKKKKFQKSKKKLGGN
jgi:hypothetical protein